MDVFIAEAIEEMKQQNRHCPKACNVDGGLGKCVGRGDAMPERPIVLYGAGDKAVLADLKVDRIDEVPVDCPFFAVGTERG